MSDVQFRHRPFAARMKPMAGFGRRIRQQPRFHHTRSNVRTDQMFVQCAGVVEKGVARLEEFFWNKSDADSITNSQAAPKFCHWIGLGRPTEGFYDIDVNEAKMVLI